MSHSESTRKKRVVKKETPAKKEKSGALKEVGSKPGKAEKTQEVIRPSETKASSRRRKSSGAEPNAGKLILDPSL